ncbi:MAG: hypothetical protein P8O76_02170 [Methylophilaceae bacterium]|nr:hypothetical protein [Methylophilaceae bacterium]
MITENHLQSAIAAGILDETTANALKAHANNNPIADEENFRLLSGFNDIFVVIASLLLLTSISWMSSAPIGQYLAAITAWGLAEYFVRMRRMALPAIVLLLAFIIFIFAGTKYLITPIIDEGAQAFIIPSLIATIAAWLHWRRFQVPITIAAGTAALVVTLLAALMTIEYNPYIAPITVIIGLTVFAFAMFWDSKDTQRQTKNADIAFWLHLLAAPIIIHPLFEIIGVLYGNINGLQASLVFILYLAISLISLLIDRRALMVSALGYVVYVFTTLLRDMGHIDIGFAVTAFTIGSALLLLSAYWHQCRHRLLAWLPAQLKPYLPN